MHTTPSLLPLTAHLSPTPLDTRLRESANAWRRDLETLLDHAQERFGDICWELGEGLGVVGWGELAPGLESADATSCAGSRQGSEIIWGHKGTLD